MLCGLDVDLDCTGEFNCLDFMCLCWFGFASWVLWFGCVFCSFDGVDVAIWLTFGLRFSGFGAIFYFCLGLG